MHTHSEGDALPLSLVNTALVLLRCHALRQRVHRIHIRVRKCLLHAASCCRGQRSQARCRGKGLRRRPQRYELAQGCVYARSRGSTGRLGHCGEHVSFCHCRSHVAASREQMQLLARNSQISQTILKGVTARSGRRFSDNAPPPVTRQPPAHLRTLHLDCIFFCCGSTSCYLACRTVPYAARSNITACPELTMSVWGQGLLWFTDQGGGRTYKRTPSSKLVIALEHAHAGLDITENWSFSCTNIVHVYKGDKADCAKHATRTVCIQRSATSSTACAIAQRVAAHFQN